MLNVVDENKVNVIADKIDLLNEALLGFDEKNTEEEFSFSDEDGWA